MKPILLLGAAVGLFTFLGNTEPAEAANCGAENQRPCKLWERIPSCNSGLVEVVGPSRCVRKENSTWIPKPPPRPSNCGKAGQKPCPLPHIPSCNGRLVEDFSKGICRQADADIVNMAKDTIRQSGRLLKETAVALADCTGAKNILQGGGSKADKASRLGETPCVRAMIEGAGRAGYQSYSIGLGFGGGLVAGVEAESGFIFDTAYRRPPAAYVSYGYSFGPQVGGGGFLSAGYGTSPNTPGRSIAHGASVSGGAGIGTGVAAWFSYDGKPDGIGIALSGGADLSANYARNETRIVAIPGARVPSKGGATQPAPSSGSTILRSGTGKCLDVVGAAARNNGANVQVWDCNSGANQKWRFANGTLINGAGLCLDVHGPDARRNGGNVQVWKCNGGPNQQWSRQGNTLKNGFGFCLDAHGPDARRNGGNVQAWQCHGGVNQTWN